MIHNDVKIPPIRSVVKNQAIKFTAILNPALQNIPIYDERAHWRRHRVTLLLLENIDSDKFLLPFTLTGFLILIVHYISPFLNFIYIFLYISLLLLLIFSICYAYFYCTYNGL